MKPLIQNRPLIPNRIGSRFDTLEKSIASLKTPPREDEISFLQATMPLAHYLHFGLIPGIVTFHALVDKPFLLIPESESVGVNAQDQPPYDPTFMPNPAHHKSMIKTIHGYDNFGSTADFPRAKDGKILFASLCQLTPQDPTLCLFLSQALKYNLFSHSPKNVVDLYANYVKSDVAGRILKVEFIMPFPNRLTYRSRVILEHYSFAIKYGWSTYLKYYTTTACNSTIAETVFGVPDGQGAVYSSPPYNGLDRGPIDGPLDLVYLDENAHIISPFYEIHMFRTWGEPTSICFCGMLPDFTKMDKNFIEVSDETYIPAGWE